MSQGGDIYKTLNESLLELSQDLPYMWNLKRNDTNELTKQRLTDLENELIVARGKDGEKGQLEGLG